MALEVPLLPMYVEGLDKSLGGGIPNGSIVLVAGSPGTLKTSLVLWTMRENARRHGTKGLYLTLEQDARSLRTQAARMGGDLPESQVYIVDLPHLRRGRPETESSKDWIRILRMLAEEGVSSSGYQVFAIDSLEALYSLAGMKAPRREMFHFLSALKELGATTFLISETPFGSTRLAQWGEDFLADGIFYLRHVDGDTQIQLRLQCVKMRWMNHKHNALALNFDGERLFVTHVIARIK